MAERTLDCCDMSCPMPIVRITREVKSMQSGERLEVRATDLAFKLDLESWSRRTGHAIESFIEGDVQTAVILIR